MFESAADAAARLKHLAEALDADSVRALVVEGSPDEEIVEAVADVDASLIVMGRSGDRGELRDILGSTAESVVRHSPVPVVVAQQPSPDAIRRILVPVEESALTPRVLEVAREHAQRLNARVALLQVTDTVRYGPVFPISMDPGEHSVEDALRMEATERLARMLARAGVPRDEVELLAATGDPAREILSTAERMGAGLIVMGSRGAGLIERTLLGSVASAVLRSARCPVLVVTGHGSA